MLRRILNSITDCEGKSKSTAFMTQTETRNGQVTRTKVVTCGQVMPDEAEIAIMAHEDANPDRQNSIPASFPVLASIGASKLEHALGRLGARPKLRSS